MFALLTFLFSVTYFIYLCVVLYLNVSINNISPINLNMKTYAFEVFEIFIMILLMIFSGIVAFKPDCKVEKFEEAQIKQEVRQELAKVEQERVEQVIKQQEQPRVEAPRVEAPRPEQARVETVGYQAQTNYGDVEGNDNNIIKIDENRCSRECCKHSQWPIAHDLVPKVGSEYVGSNMSCNWGQGSGCVCLKKNDFDYLSTRGNNTPK